MSLKNKFDSVPGFENFMDTDISVDVSIGGEGESSGSDELEAAASESESAEVAAAPAEEISEATTDAQEAEMIFKRFGELMDMQTHISKYGVSKDWFAWVNRDGKLAAGLNLNVASMESIDSVGDPNSAMSIACMESIGEIVGKIWEFIKRVCTKIKDFIVRIWQKIFGSNKACEEKLNAAEAATNGEGDPEATGEAIPFTSVEACYNKFKASQPIMKELVDKCHKTADMLRSNKFDQAITSSESITELSEKLKKINNASEEDIKKLSNERFTGSGVMGKIKGWCKQAKAYIATQYQMQREYDRVKSAIDFLQTTAEREARYHESNYRNRANTSYRDNNLDRTVENLNEAKDVRQKAKAFNEACKAANKANTEILKSQGIMSAIIRKATTSTVKTANTIYHAATHASTSARGATHRGPYSTLTV